jgi:predicted RNA-binding protein YlxR (DUF448 family)
MKRENNYKKKSQATNRAMNEEKGVWTCLFRAGRSRGLWVGKEGMRREQSKSKRYTARFSSVAALETIGEGLESLLAVSRMASEMERQ